MIKEAEIIALPLNEKLRLMELLWDNIRQNPEDFHSPAWHEAELKITEERRKQGLEEPIDWDVAKKKLLDL